MEPSETFFRRMVESSPDGFWAVDLTGRTVYANPRTAELLGRRPEEMPRLSVHDVLDETGKEQFARHLEHVRVAGPIPSEVECSYLRTDGGYVRLTISEGALTDEHGQLTGFVHRMTDDGERRLLIQQLSHTREVLDDAQAIARIGSWEVDLPTWETFWSRQLFRMLDLDPDTAIASPAVYMARVLEEDRFGLDEWVRRIQSAGGEYEIDQRVPRPDGTILWFRCRAVATYDDAGNPVKLGGTVQDVTDVKNVEAQLLDAVVLNALLQVMVAAANSADTLAEAITNIRVHLLGHEDWLRGVMFEVVRDKNGHRSLTPYLADRPEFVPDPVELALARRALTTGGFLFDEDSRPATPLVAAVLTLEDQPTYVGVLTSTGPFRRPSMVRSMLSQVVDQLKRVAERERDAAVLAAARDTAMEASRLKSGFLAMISHEIRTPLNGVIGLNELLAHTDLDTQQQRLVAGIEVAGRSLLGLINDILDFSKIEAGQLELESVEFDLRALVARTVTMLSADAAGKGLAVSVEIPQQVPPRLVGDPTRLGQILTNLLSNAVKFTAEGNVTIRVAVTDVAPGSAELTVEVQDTGIGIDSEQVDRLFQPFQQADASTTRTHGGTGLGLAISRQLVQAIGGELGVRSDPGRGSTFWFTARFPIAAEVSPLPSEVRSGDDDATQEPSSGRVLLAEDNEINRMVALGLLESLGYTCDVAANGVDAVDKVSTRRYDAVLMDLQMPVMDGITATRRIRSAEPRGQRLPIVALTASAITGERERCLAAGMDDFLSKPVNLERLASVLRTHVGQAGGQVGGRFEPELRRPVQESGSPVLEPRRLEELLAMGERAKPLVERAVTNFMTSLPGTLADLEKAVADADSPALRSIAHKLRGSALNLGAARVAEVTLDLETLGDDGKAVEAGDLVRLLGQVGDETVAALATYLAGSIKG